MPCSPQQPHKTSPSPSPPLSTGEPSPHPPTPLPLPRRWVNTIYTTFFKPMGIPYGKNLAPSAAHVERIVAKNPEYYSASDFLVPAPYARHIPSLGITLVGPPSSCFGFSGSARNPWGLTLPFYKAAIVANNQTYQQLELAKSGDVSAAAARAREQQHGVSLVSYVITPSEVFTRYVGPPMQISKIDGAGCLAGSTPDMIVMPTSVPPHDFVVGERSALCGSCACCNGKAAFPLEVVAAMGGLPGDGTTTSPGTPPPVSPAFYRCAVTTPPSSGCRHRYTPVLALFNGYTPNPFHFPCPLP